MATDNAKKHTEHEHSSPHKEQTKEVEQQSYSYDYHSSAKKEVMAIYNAFRIAKRNLTQ